MKRSSGSSFARMDIFAGKGRQGGRELAMVEEMGGMLADGDAVPLWTAVGFVPMGDEPDDFAANFGFRHGSKDVQGRHGADDTGKRAVAQ